MPFVDDEELEEHWDGHGHEFGGITKAEYARRAEVFLMGTMGPNTEECHRPQGGYVRYDRVTEEYGCVRTDGTIATYFIPNPATHRFATNFAYFQARCR